MRFKLTLDAAAGVVVVGLAAAVALGTTRFPTAGGAVPGPAAFPLILAVVWAPLGVLLVLTGRRELPEANAGAVTGQRTLGLLLLTMLYAAAFPWIGFISGSALFLFGAIELLGYRRRWRSGAVALSTAFLVHWLFAGLMNVPLPAGWIG